MPDISKVKLPSGNVYDIKDAYARELIAGGVTFSVAWDGNSTPGAMTWVYFNFDFSSIPDDATVTSVSCQAKAYISNTNSSRITTRICQLYALKRN